MITNEVKRGWVWVVSKPCCDVLLLMNISMHRISKAVIF